MTSSDESLEAKLARLSVETAELRPGADFTQRVMAAVEAPLTSPVPMDWTMEVLRWAKLGTAVASLAALVCVFFALDSTDAAEQEEAVAYGMSEAFE